MTYTEAVAWLYSLQLHGIKLGLENMRRLCAELGLALDGKGGPAFVHVAGTNGKGSVCAMFASVCREAGLRTGLYTSPHLVTFRERIQVDGELIPEESIAEGLTRIRGIVEQWPNPPTFFEIVTALALAWFAEHKVDVAVLETGLGGRLDATNVVTPAVSILTSIGFDHRKYLGYTLAEIATEKCGIIKPGVPIVSAPQSPEAAAVIQRRAMQTGSALVFPHQPVTSSLALKGRHQQWNAALVIEALRVVASNPVFRRVGFEHIAAGFAHAQWPGRFQMVGDRTVLDGAHNAAAAETLVDTWRSIFGEQKATLILGVMRDKDVAAVCTTLAPLAARVVPVTVNNPRSCTAEELAEVVRDAVPGIVCEPQPNVRAALAAANERVEPILISGSLFLVGEAYCALGLAEGEPEKTAQ